jgi:hypothetical protein
MAYWSILPEDDVLRFIKQYFELYQVKYNRAQFGGWETEYRVINTDLTLTAHIDKDNYVSELQLITWDHGFSHLQKCFRVRKGTDKRIDQMVYFNSYSDGGVRTIYDDPALVYKYMHQFIKHLHPKESMSIDRDMKLKEILI